MMGEVVLVPGRQGVDDCRQCKQEEIMSTTSDAGDQVNSVPSIAFVAPFVRIEELKDDAVSGDGLGGYSSESGCSSIYGTDDEYALSGEASSDQDAMSPTLRSEQETKTGIAEAFELPTDELKKRIVEQVEYYFSNENIVHDAFMLKHVRRNKLGYVSLKLVTSFRKVKSLTKDYRVVAFCLRSSEKLDVNEEGTKVRRTDPLPDHDETTPSRTIVAANLPFENPTVEDVAERFSKFGEIALIRILRPGKPAPQDVKKHLAKYPELGSAICALVEYERHESAKAACEQVNEAEGIESGNIRIILLSQPKKNSATERKEGQQAAGRKTPKESGQQSSREDRKKSSHSDDHSGRNTLSPYQDPNRLSPCQSPGTTPRSSPKSTPRSSPRASPNSMRRRTNHGPSPLVAGDNVRSSSPERWSKTNVGHLGEGRESPLHSPWVQRRLRAQEGSPLTGNSPGTSPRLGRRAMDSSSVDGVKGSEMFGVVRQPKGPDGTRGFQLSRAK